MRRKVPLEVAGKAVWEDRVRIWDRQERISGAEGPKKRLNA